MPCKKCAFEFQKGYIVNKTKKLAIFKSLLLPFGSMYFNESGADFFSGSLCYRKQIRKNLLEYFWRFCKAGNKKKVASLPCRGRKNLQIYSCYFLPDLRYDQKHFIRIPPLNVPEMRPLGTFYFNFIKRLTWERSVTSPSKIDPTDFQPTPLEPHPFY